MKNTLIKAKQKRSKDTRQYASDSNPDIAKGLRYLFVDELKDIYWAEKALTKALPRMIRNAQTPELINAISEHLDFTIGHVARLEKVFFLIGAKAVARKCETIDGLIRELENIISNTEEGIVRDAGIISIAQKVEHFEIASYGTLCAFAETLWETEAAALLKQTLDEEKEADEFLTSIAKSSISLETVYDDFEYGLAKRRTA